MFCLGLLLSEYPVLCMQVVCEGIMSDPDLYIYIPNRYIYICIYYMYTQPVYVYVYERYASIDI